MKVCVPRTLWKEFTIGASQRINSRAKHWSHSNSVHLDALLAWRSGKGHSCTDYCKHLNSSDVSDNLDAACLICTKDFLKVLHRQACKSCFWRQCSHKAAKISLRVLNNASYFQSVVFELNFKSGQNEGLWPDYCRQIQNWSMPVRFGRDVVTVHKIRKRQNQALQPGWVVNRRQPGQGSASHILRAAVKTRKSLVRVKIAAEGGGLLFLSPPSSRVKLESKTVGLKWRCPTDINSQSPVHKTGICEVFKLCILIFLWTPRVLRIRNRFKKLFNRWTSAWMRSDIVKIPIWSHVGAQNSAGAASTRHQQKRLRRYSNWEHHFYFSLHGGGDEHSS